MDTSYLMLAIRNPGQPCPQNIKLEYYSNRKSNPGFKDDIKMSVLISLHTFYPAMHVSMIFVESVSVLHFVMTQSTHYPVNNRWLN